MKSALSLTLIVCLVGSTVPAAAQAPVAADPIARSITREAARFAAAQQNQSADAEWSRVRGLAPGTEVIVTVHGSPPGTRYVVLADTSDLTVLNVADSTLPVAARLLTNASVLAEPLDAVSESQQPADAWDSVQGLLPGTRLKLTFNDGSEVTGTVVETRADAVVMNDNQPGRAGLKTPRGSSLRDKLTFTRSDVATVSVLKVPTRYRASGSPDAVAVRHVVTALGIGKKIDLKTTSSMWGSQRGTIRSIEQDGFRVVRGFRAPADFVAYSDVDQVEAAGLPWALKAAIIFFGLGPLVTVFVLPAS